MNHMNKWIVLLCGTLAGCQMTPTKNADDTVCRTIDISATLDREPEPVRLSEWAKSVRFVPLETNDSILLTANLAQIILHDDHLIIFDGKNVYLFNMEGRFIRKIGNRGEGPEDYLSGGNIRADRDGIHIIDNSKWIKTYGWDGKWKQTSHIPENKNIREVLHLSDGRNLGYVQNISGKEPTRMYIFRDSTVLDSVAYNRRYEPGEITMVFYDECFTYSTPKADFVKEMFNDTIFRITDRNTLQPKWVIDAGKYKMPDGARYSLKDPRASLFKDRVNIQVLGEYNETLYFAPSLNGKTHNLYFDPKTGETYSVAPSYPQNEFAFAEGKTFVPAFISDDNRYLIGYEAQENDENPVIILVER